MNNSDFDKTYRRIKSRGKKKIAKPVILKSVRTLVFSSAVLASALSGVKVGGTLQKQFDIEKNFDPVRADANNILYSNIYFNPEEENVDAFSFHSDENYAHFDMAQDIKEIEAEKGSLYGQAVLVKLLDSVDSRSVAHDKYILQYLDIPADNFLEYANLEGYSSTKEMLNDIKEKFYEKERMRRK